MDSYLPQREVYDLVHRTLQNHTKEVAILLKRVRGAIGVDPQSWLDCACGTGLHLAALQEEGVTHLAGIDNSPAQLDVAHHRLTNVSLHLADMRDFSITVPTGGFQVISCLLSSVGHLATDGEYLSALQRMAHHLSPKGVVLVEPWIALEDFHPGRLDVDRVAIPKGEVVQITKHSLKEEGDLSFSHLEFRWLVSQQGQKSVRDWTMDMDLRLRSLQQQVELFQQVFSWVEVQSTGAGSRGIILARKPH